MTEEWRAVVGVPGYEVSSLGNVRSIDRSVPCRDGRTRRFKGAPIRGAWDKKLGYHRVVLYVQGKPIARTVHSLVAEAFIGPCPEGEEVRHRNGQHADNAWTNLRYGTRGENNEDQVEHGTHANARKTECKRQHLLKAPNLVPSSLPRRDCLACSYARAYIIRHPELELKKVADEYFERIMGEAA